MLSAATGVCEWRKRKPRTTLVILMQASVIYMYVTRSSFRTRTKERGCYLLQVTEAVTKTRWLTSLLTIRIYS